MYEISAANLLASLPDVLAQDESMYALAETISNVLSVRPTEIDKIRIYPNIDALPETLLDILAYDFKVDWWDDSLTLAEKRATLKKSWYVHKHIGTPSAVKTALSAVYPGTIVLEWFEYEGSPYHFKIKIAVDSGSLDPNKHAKVMALVSYYKNLRSVLDSVEYSGASNSVTIYPVVGCVGDYIHEYALANFPEDCYGVDENSNQLIDENEDLILI